jgi:hypothetical protein
MANSHVERTMKQQNLLATPQHRDQKFRTTLFMILTFFDGSHITSVDKAIT